MHFLAKKIIMKDKIFAGNSLLSALNGVDGARIGRHKVVFRQQEADVYGEKRGTADGDYGGRHT